MSRRLALGLLAGLLGLAGGAQQAARVERPAAAPSASAAAPAPTPAPPEPPKQADQLARIASELVELQNAIAKDPGLRGGVNVAGGHVTHAAVAQGVGMEFTPVEQALTPQAA